MKEALRGGEAVGDIPRPAPLDRLLVRAALRWPDRPAIWFDESVWTFREVDAAARRVAQALMSLGVRPGDRVGIWMSNRPEWVVAQFAVVRLGAVLVPLNTRLRRDDLAYALHDCGARAVFTQAGGGFAYLDVLAEIGEAGLCPELRHVIVANDEGGAEYSEPLIGWSALEELAAACRAEPAPASNPDEPAFILYTSGTTSAPKGATLSHTNLNNAFNVAQNMCAGDAVFVAYPLFAVTGCHNSVLAATIAGAGLVLQERFDAGGAIELIEKHGCAVYNGIIATLRDIAAVPNFDPARLRTLRHANVFPRRPEHAPLLTRIGFSTAGTGYGMTETAGPVTHATDPVGCFSPGEGTPWPGNELRLLDNEGRDVASGEIGEIHVRSSQVMLGYYNKPEATRAAIDSHGWLRTRDMGYLTPEGALVWVGRNDDVFKSSGFNVSALEVESFLVAHPKLAEVAVIGVPDERRGAVGAAFVIPRAGVSVSMQDIETFCRGRIASHKIPGHVVSLDEFPRTTSGKVRKLELRDRHFGVPWRDARQHPSA